MENTVFGVFFEFVIITAMWDTYMKVALKKNIAWSAIYIHIGVNALIYGALLSQGDLWGSMSRIIGKDEIISLSLDLLLVFISAGFFGSFTLIRPDKPKSRASKK